MSINVQPITDTELLAYPGRGNGLTAEAAQQWVEVTNALVLDHWTNPTPVVPGRVKAIALEAAARASRNPKGLASWTRAVDDGSRTERLPDATARAGVYLTADEIVRLNRDPAAAGRRRRYGNIQPRLGRV